MRKQQYYHFLCAKEFIGMLENNQTLDDEKNEVIQWAKNRIEKLDFMGSLE